jgi:hypothetical protein
MAECEFDLWLDLPSLNLLTHEQEPRKIDMDDEELDG